MWQRKTKRFIGFSKLLAALPEITRVLLSDAAAAGTRPRAPSSIPSVTEISETGGEAVATLEQFKPVPNYGGLHRQGLLPQLRSKRSVWSCDHNGALPARVDQSSGGTFARRIAAI